MNIYVIMRSWVFIWWLPWFVVLNIIFLFSESSLHSMWIFLFVAVYWCRVKLNSGAYGENIWILWGIFILAIFYNFQNVLYNFVKSLLSDCGKLIHVKHGRVPFISCKIKILYRPSWRSFSCHCSSIFDRQWTMKGRRWPFSSWMYSFLEVILCHIILLYKLLFFLIYIRYETLSSQKKERKWLSLRMLNCAYILETDDACHGTYSLCR